jgi:lipopolysaccharide biosynthesis protein
MQTNKPKLIAYFLPQFHPTPENDLWWGKGFTEWTNVTKARALFEGHYQPHLPADLGFYDLRLKETRHEQIKLAKQYGIDGFCYHYYWFSGERILNRPIDDMYADKESDMPYCFCWANENWTRRWDAAEHEVLLAQKYLPDDDINFIKQMVKFFQDPRYIKVDGAPILIVYRPQHLPDSKKTIKIYQ